MGFQLPFPQLVSLPDFWLPSTVVTKCHLLLPKVEVTGFASSDLSRGRANGVAVPDVDIVPRKIFEGIRPNCVPERGLEIFSFQDLPRQFSRVNKIERCLQTRFFPFVEMGWSLFRVGTSWNRADFKGRIFLPPSSRGLGGSRVFLGGLSLVVRYARLWFL